MNSTWTPFFGRAMWRSASGNPKIVTKRIPVHITKKDWLSDSRHLPPFAYHGCLMWHAEEILKKGNKPGFSITGSRAEALAYAFSAAVYADEPGAVLKISTSYITKEIVDRSVYREGFTPQYLHLLRKLPPQAFSLDSIIPIEPIKKSQDEMFETLADQLEDFGVPINQAEKVRALYLLFSPLSFLSVVRKLKTNADLLNKGKDWYDQHEFYIFELGGFHLKATLPMHLGVTTGTEIQVTKLGDEKFSIRPRP